MNSDKKQFAEIPEKFLKPYDPQNTEARIYKLWEDSGYFNPDNLPGDRKEAFTIMMPPPNVTGVLHMGHALGTTIQDILIRYNRMNGKKTLWLPGTDHAAIATQSKVEKEISKTEGKSRHDLGREELLRRVREFAQNSHDTIVSQIKTLGASCDWSREAFTLDEKRNLAVNTVFKKMYDDGLIYRAHRIVNWDPKGQTTISDDEIVYEEREAKFYTFKYSKDFPISISTTRPETKVGDVAVAVHPDDSRYQKYIGQTFEVPDFCGVKLSIKIIGDVGVDKEFGTGALGVTPAHSMIDWEMAEKNNLPIIPVINEYAKMSVGDERILGKKTTEAREVIVEWLRAEGLLESEVSVKQNVSTAERTSGIVEPLPKLQWFVDVNKEVPGRGKSLKDLTREPVEDGRINIVPDFFGKTYFHWIDNLRDWCISRQIWYGHRIPVYYKGDEMFVGDKSPGDDWKQDEDTLDTWFSSALWTFSTLGWPEKTEDLKFFHPTDVLETGYEILFFWIARMVLMTNYVLREIPFKNVYLHGTVRDAKGRKMSKSLGNGLDPVEVAEKFGTDAARMALIVGTAPGTDMRIDENKIKGYKNFANKVWNVTRFILQNADKPKMNANLVEADQKLLTEINGVVKDVTSDLENMRLHLASEKIYSYIWHTLADKILEESKSILAESGEATESRKRALHEILHISLKILHPFMPFLTEEIWHEIHNGKPEKLLIIEEWPA
jgi:valyl-tRNA synthetase